MGTAKLLRRPHGLDGCGPGRPVVGSVASVGQETRELPDRGVDAGQRAFTAKTGAIEGAWRQEIGDRLDITGARWGLAIAEAVLKLRALHDNDDFDKHWTFHLAREHERLYPTPDRHSHQLTACPTDFPEPELHPSTIPAQVWAAWG